MIQHATTEQPILHRAHPCYHSGERNRISIDISWCHHHHLLLTLTNIFSKRHINVEWNYHKPSKLGSKLFNDHHRRHPCSLFANGSLQQLLKPESAKSTFVRPTKNEQAIPDPAGTFSATRWEGHGHWNQEKKGKGERKKEDQKTANTKW